jgi:hypothetical protein
MAGVFAVLAGAVVLLHLSFVLFVVCGALLALRWPWAPYFHVPAVIWAAYIEFSGGICPLTPLENDFRARAGLNGYSGDFVARYLLPVLYPDGLTWGAQVVVGITALGVNLALYVWLVQRRRRVPP